MGGGYACINKGICLINGTCMCQLGYSGDQCQSYTGCIYERRLACQNNGLCLPDGSCKCPAGFIGSMCQTCKNKIIL